MAWLLPSLNRPKQAAHTLKAFARHGSTPGVLWVDGSREGYEAVALPAGWSVVYADEQGRRGIAESMRWLYEQQPDAPWYGWIADDMTPMTDAFDTELIETAAGKYFVYCSGDKHKTPAKWAKNAKGVPSTIPSAMMWAGGLVRAVGWWAPPWSRWSCIDEAWKQLTMRTALARYRHDVIVQHKHWMTGGRPKDDTDNEGMDRARNDIGPLKAWLESPEFGRLVRRLEWELR